MAGGHNKFPRYYRLTKTDEFSSVFGFRKAVKGNFFVLHYGPPSEGNPRLGVVVGKKLLKQAVRRNTVKRIVREAFRQQKMQLPTRDVIVRLTGKFPGMPRQSLNLEVLSLFARLSRRSSSPAELEKP